MRRIAAGDRLRWREGGADLSLPPFGGRVGCVEAQPAAPPGRLAALVRRCADAPYGVEHWEGRGQA